MVTIKNYVMWAILKRSHSSHQYHNQKTGANEHRRYSALCCQVEENTYLCNLNLLAAFTNHKLQIIMIALSAVAIDINTQCIRCWKTSQTWWQRADSNRCTYIFLQLIINTSSRPHWWQKETNWLHDVYSGVQCTLYTSGACLAEHKCL
jgi:hypothetical protein